MITLLPTEKSSQENLVNPGKKLPGRGVTPHGNILSNRHQQQDARRILCALRVLIGMRERSTLSDWWYGLVAGGDGLLPGFLSRKPFVVKGLLSYPCQRGWAGEGGLEGLQWGGGGER
jgi:hypothetical protein